MATAPVSSNAVSGCSGDIQRERASARWSILRNALLHKAQESSSQHSIHRFQGYKLLRPLPQTDMDISRLESSLKVFTWDPSKDSEDNLERLDIAVLALGACFPKGVCMHIKGFQKKCDKTWIEILKSKCGSSANLLLVEHDQSRNAATLLVQEGSKSKYKSCQYVLDENCSIWTREPRKTRLSLEDLVSHRTTGVDNTGNICVWDSERTLAYLLYNHLADVPGLNSPQNILELGTGMAGLAAVSLGLRLAQQSNKNQAKSINIILTDGHCDGVKNNSINQHLTKIFSSTQDHPYHSLCVSTDVLLWTTSPKANLESLQDIVLVSDCTHFQNFHSALAVTMLRSLRVGGTAIFCQPNRGDSLENFCTLLKIPQNHGLTTLNWWTHPCLEESHKQAQNAYLDVYDPNLHRPKLLLVTKLRELTDSDCHQFESHQSSRDSVEEQKG